MRGFQNQAPIHDRISTWVPRLTPVRDARGLAWIHLSAFRRAPNDGDGGVRRDVGDDDDKVVIHGGEYAAHGVVYGDLLSRYAMAMDGRFASRMSRAYRLTR
jgi:hypothetical protein